MFNLHDCRPDLIELMPLLASKSRLLIAKLSPMLDVTQTLRDLPMATRLYVVEERGECRELLAVADFSSGVDHNGMDAEIIATDCNKFYRFTLAEEREAEMRFGVPEIGMPRERAKSARGRTPVTGRSVPFSDNSAAKKIFSRLSTG